MSTFILKSKIFGAKQKEFNDVLVPDIISNASGKIISQKPSVPAVVSPVSTVTSSKIPTSSGFTNSFKTRWGNMGKFGKAAALGAGIGLTAMAFNAFRPKKKSEKSYSDSCSIMKYRRNPKRI